MGAPVSEHRPFSKALCSAPWLLNPASLASHQAWSVDWACLSYKAHLPIHTCHKLPQVSRVRAGFSVFSSFPPTALPLCTTSHEFFPLTPGNMTASSVLWVRVTEHPASACLLNGVVNSWLKSEQVSCQVPFKAWTGGQKATKVVRSRSTLRLWSLPPAQGWHEGEERTTAVRGGNGTGPAPGSVRN